MISERTIQLLAISLFTFTVTAITWPLILPGLQAYILPYLITIWALLQPFVNVRSGILLSLITLTVVSGHIYDHYLQPERSNHLGQPVLPHAKIDEQPSSKTQVTTKQTPTGT